MITVLKGLSIPVLMLLLVLHPSPALKLASSYPDLLELAAGVGKIQQGEQDLGLLSDHGLHGAALHSTAPLISPSFPS